MKKKIFGAVVIVAIAVGTMMNVNLNKVSNKGDLAMANVEALAQEEGGGKYCGTPAKCSDTKTVETYTTDESGWTFKLSVGWLLNGEVGKGSPKDYKKTISTVNSAWDGCKPMGVSDCYAPPC